MSRSMRNFASWCIAIAAVAWSSQGLAQTAAPAAKNVPPTVSIASPQGGSTFSAGQPIVVTANASDIDGTVTKVDFFSELSATVPFGTAPAAPYSATWTNAPVGTHTITAKATDNKGATATASITVTVIPNPPPTVSITSPVSGATFVAPATVPLAATATDNTSVSLVEYFQGTTFIGSASSAPYTLNWTGVTEGGYTLTAKATDSQGGTAVSAPVSMAVGRPPLVAMNSPAACVVVTLPATVFVSADAVDLDGWITQVEFFADGAPIGTSFVAPYAVSWNNPPEGVHAITARATNNFGGRTLSTPASITVTTPNLAPTAAITTPTAGSSFRTGSTITITATANDPDGTVSFVSFYRNGIFIASSNGPVFSVPWLASVPAGPYALTAIATDNRNLPGNASAPVNITITPNALPTATLTSPTSGATFREPATIPFSANATDSDGTISLVEFKLGNNVVAQGVPGTPPTFTGTATNVAAGTYTATAKATDNDNGSFTSLGVLITVTANAQPTVSITSPANGAMFTAPVNIPIAATASDTDGSIAKVEFFDGTTLMDTVTTLTGSPAAYRTTLSNAALGSHSLTAKATDNDGATRTSTAVTITVGGMTSVITSPANNSTFVAPAAYNVNATVSTSAGSITAVDFYDGTTLLQTQTPGAGFATVNAQLILSGIVAGTHVYTVVGHASGGGTATSPPVTVVVTPPPTPPTVTLTSPAPNQFYSAPATVRLAANATPGSAPIQKVEFFHEQTLITTMTSAPYTFDWTNVPAGNYSLTAKATDSGGGFATSPPVLITVGSLVVTITTPANGATLSGNDVLVRGTIQAPANSGVLVNGAVAATDAAGNFSLNVPLVAGTSSLDAVVTTPAGSTATQSIVVSSDGQTPVVSIQVAPLEGLTPLVATATLRNNGTADVVVRVDGNVAGTLPAGQSVTFDLTYTGSGSVPLAISATDPQNNVVQRQFIVVALTPAQLDQKLRAVWGGITDALASGDKATALLGLSSGAREKFGPVFDALASRMPAIVASFSTPVTGMLTSDMGEFVVNRVINGQNRAFFIYMIHDSDGVWRLESM